VNTRVNTQHAAGVEPWEETRIMRHAWKTLAGRALIGIAVAALAGCSAIPAADAQTQSDGAAPPWLAGRIAVIEGDVRIHQPRDPSQQGQDEWQQAIANDVVTNGSTIYTGPDSRTELQVGGHALRLDESSQVTVQSLDDSESVVQLDGGVLNLRWRDYEHGSLRVLTASGEVDLIAAGRYRIDLHQDGATVTVFEGRAQVVQNGNTVPVEAGRALTATSGRFGFGTVETTVFDQWALSRDQRQSSAIATRYVSPNMTGFEDLDANGRWDTDPDYGTVWYPYSVQSDWAPYRYGQWRWVPPWGWTWVDSAPWGFAPFHYGRWVQVRGSWGWAPGGYAQRPVYAPALVGYAGGVGGGVAFSYSQRPSAWYPLAPWQSYQPWYRHDNGYYNNVNRPITHNQPPRGGPPPDVNQHQGMTRDPIRYGRPTERGPAVPVMRPPETAAVPGRFEGGNNGGYNGGNGGNGGNNDGRRQPPGNQWQGRPAIDQNQQQPGARPPTYATPGGVTPMQPQPQPGRAPVPFQTPNQPVQQPQQPVVQQPQQPQYQRAPSEWKRAAPAERAAPVVIPQPQVQAPQVQAPQPPRAPQPQVQPQPQPQPQAPQQPREPQQPRQPANSRPPAQQNIKQFNNTN
jgi:hypothetical protein